MRAAQRAAEEPAKKKKTATMRAAQRTGIRLLGTSQFLLGTSQLEMNGFCCNQTVIRSDGTAAPIRSP
ncbi:Uncharacterised protein [Mycobacterium tuberculosis]|nr:Uncharacterised protein [Mycobacterium tuberculosis]